MSARRGGFAVVAVGMFVLVGLALVSSASAQPTPPVAPSEVGDRLDVDRFDLVRLAVPEDGAASAIVSLPLDGEPCELVLEHCSLRAPDFRVLVGRPDGTLAEVPPPAPRTYRGWVVGRAETRVAATLYDGQLTALIVAGDELWGLQPLSEFAPGADAAVHVLYRSEDVRPIDVNLATDMLFPPGWSESPEPAGFGGGLPCDMLCQIAFDADYEFYRLNGSSVPETVADIEFVLSGVEAIFARDVQIAYELTTVIVRESEPDPYSSNDPYGLIYEFRDEWRQNQTDVVRDVAHLMTGKFMGGIVVGLSWVGVICDQDYGFGWSRSRFSSNTIYRVGLTAHELGHNWNARHCDGAPDCYIMCSELGGCAGDLTRFGTQAVSAITAHRDTRDCLTEAGPHIVTQPTPYQLVCAGQMVSLSVEVAEPLVSYQWRRGTTELHDDGVHVFGATSATLMLLGVTETDAASDYNCLVTDLTNGCQAVSDYAEIDVDTHVPVITQQPADQTVEPGGIATVHVGVEQPYAADFEWRREGVPLEDDGRIMGATTDTLVIYPVEPADAGSYDCLVTSQLGSHCAVTSDPALLTVAPGDNCPEDLNGDGRVDLSDLSQLLAHYRTPSGASPEHGDIDRDGDVDLEDLAALLARYRQDCPGLPQQGSDIDPP